MRSFMEKVFSADDLNRGIFSARSADTNPPYFAVLGKPISHSQSPLMQNAALEEIAKSDVRYKGSRYFAFEVSPEGLSDSLDKFWNKNFAGINLTIPHKEIAAKLLSDMEDGARLARACNTLLRTSDGWKGFNTDGFGLEEAVRSSLGRDFKGSDVVVIGAGGAARGAAFHIASCGCKSLLIANRTQERLDRLVSDLKNSGFECYAASLADCGKLVPENSIVVNATSVGLRDSDSAVLDFSVLPKSTVFFDMPYRKGCETVSVLSARAAGILACSGLPMRAWQGAKSLSIWTGKPMLGELMLKTLNES